MSHIVLDENAIAPATPAAGKSIIYPKANGLWYMKDDAGVETAFAYVAPAAPVPRVTGTTSSSTPTPDADTTDLYSLTALAASAAFGTPTGTPVNAQKLLIRIKDNGTARALTWSSAYVAGGSALPSTTVLSKILTIGLIYNTDNSLNKWQCVAVAQEG